MPGIVHEVEASVGDHASDAPPFLWLEGDVPVGENDQDWNVPFPARGVDVWDVVGVRMPVVPGNHLGEGCYSRPGCRRGMGHFVLLHCPGVHRASERPAAAEGHFSEQVHSSNQETGEAAVSEYQAEQERNGDGLYQGIADNEGADVVLMVDGIAEAYGSTPSPVRRW